MGKSTISMENHHFQWENPLFLWKITIFNGKIHYIFLWKITTFNGKINYFYGKSQFSTSDVEATKRILLETVSQTCSRQFLLKNVMLQTQLFGKTKSCVPSGYVNSLSDIEAMAQSK